ncbi:2-hydroxychromene-2-carboxylate isomerase [soil metagenome]
MTKPTLKFWFEFASTYSHIAAQRIEALASEAGVEIAWRPFLLGPIFGGQGWTDSPFNIYPAKGAYMWRDMERECDRFGIPMTHPSQFPRNGLAAARLATAAEGEVWAPAFIRGVYLANFADDRDVADAAVLHEVLVKAGCPDPDAALEAAASTPVKQRLRERTDQAIALGIFGAPTFVVAGDIFWGADRIDQALAAARSA